MDADADADADEDKVDDDDRAESDERVTDVFLVFSSSCSFDSSLRWPILPFFPSSHRLAFSCFGHGRVFLDFKVFIVVAIVVFIVPFVVVVVVGGVVGVVVVVVGVVVGAVVSNTPPSVERPLFPVPSRRR